MGGTITPNIMQQIRNYFGDMIFFNQETKKLQVRDEYVMPFLSISAYANSNTMESLNTEDRFLSKVNNDVGNQIKKDYENATEYYLEHGKELDKDKLVNQLAARKAKFYKGNIFMPINGMTIGAHLANSQNYNKSVYSDVNGSVENQDIITT